MSVRDPDGSAGFGSSRAGRTIAPYCRIQPARAEHILDRVTAAVTRWRTVGAELGMSPAELSDFEDAFRVS